MLVMGSVVDLSVWLDARTGGANGGGADVDRLEGAVERLYPLVLGALDRRGALAPRVETELLAVMGELTLGLVDEAATRAERLAGELRTRPGARRG
jgi:hypothetical protein